MTQNSESQSHSDSHSSQQEDFWTTQPNHAQELRTAAINRRQREYVQQFSRYLGRKLADNQQLKTRMSMLPPSNREENSLENQLNRRRMAENTSEVRLERMMEHFKTLDTYVNVKQFIEEVNAANRISVFRNKRHCSRDRPTLPIQCSSMGKELPLNSRDLFERVNRHIKPLAGKCMQKQIREIGEICNNFSKLDEDQMYVYINEFLSQKPSSEITEGRQSKFSNQRNTSPLGHLFEQVATTEIDEQYYKQFRENIEAISRKMRNTLNNAHEKKWKRPSKKVRSESMQKLNPNKPILNEKYRAWAPKHYFRWRVGQKVYTEEQLEEKKSKVLNSSEAPVKKERATTHINERIRVSTICTPSLNPSPPHESIIYKPLRRNARKVSLDKVQLHFGNTYDSAFVSKARQTNKTLKEIKELYRFRQPMVKENLLKKVGQFIRLTEEQQLELRKHTSYINGLINKIENKRKLDFSRFDAETMEVALEDIKRFSDLQKKHSLA